MARRDGHFKFARGALRDIESLAEGDLERRAARIQRYARQEASFISPRLAAAITAVPAKTDSNGPYVDVGYDKNHPGWVLWWHEVGTQHYPATPHLRPALEAGR